jgi:hypothetical protein
LIAAPFVSADSAAPTSSAEVLQLPATMVVSPWNKLAVRRSGGRRVKVHESGDDQPRRLITCAAWDRGIRLIAAISVLTPRP